MQKVLANVLSYLSIPSDYLWKLVYSFTLSVFNKRTGDNAGILRSPSSFGYALEPLRSHGPIRH